MEISICIPDVNLGSLIYTYAYTYIHILHRFIYIYIDTHILYVYIYRPEKWIAFDGPFGPEAEVGGAGYFSHAGR